MALVDELGRLHIADALKNARRDLDNGGAKSKLGRDGGDFEPDQASADNEERLGSLQLRLERKRLRFGPQIVDAPPGRKQRQRPVDRAGGENERVVGDALAIFRRRGFCRAVDRLHRSAGFERDAFAGDAGRPRDRRVMRHRLADQHRFRERWLLVGLAMLVAKHHDFGGLVLIAGRHCGADCCRTAANDYDLAGGCHILRLFQCLAVGR